MDEYLSSRQNEILWKLLANPADTGELYANNLHRLAKDFPQSGLLQALLMRSSGNQQINHASAYFDPRALYTLVNTPEILAPVSHAQIIQWSNGTVEDAVIHNNDLIQPEQEVSVLDAFSDADTETHTEYAEPGELQETPAVETDPLDEDDVTVEPVDNIVQEEEHELTSIEVAPIIEDEVNTSEITADFHEEITEHSTEGVEPVNEEEPIVEDTLDSVYEEVQEISTSETEQIIITPANEAFYEDELVTEAGAVEQDESEDVTEGKVEAEPVVESLYESELVDEVDEPVIEHIAENEVTTEPIFFIPEAHKGIDDDVYDEIVGIEHIDFAPVTKTPDESLLPVDTASEERTFAEEAKDTTDGEERQERDLDLGDEAEQLIVGNIAATDYFVFDKAVGERKQAEESGAHDTAVGQPVGQVSASAENQDVSKYHDDNMPYTFMWWLNKTRKEHAGIYQPFKLDTSQAIRQNGADELQQQYYENIFHINSIGELDKSTPNQTIEFDTKRKEDMIIKRFITEEPHIKPPSNDKLDNENKAKKSAEDHDALVTETLARIYSDQMLYHKAINTYKKLMLKFPEKSRYFGDQIEQLERKTN